MDHLFWANQNNNNTDFTYKYHILLPIFLLGYEKIDKNKTLVQLTSLKQGVLDEPETWDHYSYFADRPTDPK